MPRPIRRLTVLLAAVAVACSAAACGTEQIQVPKSDPNYTSDYAAAQLFHQRCGGCHTLYYAATTGSGDNPRTYIDISGPNFNDRCERPVARVLYAIENGGFGGEYMPANIVVGQQAREIAMFVSKFAGFSAPVEPDSTPCQQQGMGSLPTTATGGVPPSADTSTTNTGTSPGSAEDQSDVSAQDNNPK